MSFKLKFTIDESLFIRDITCLDNFYFYSNYFCQFWTHKKADPFLSNPATMSFMLQVKQ